MTVAGTPTYMAPEIQDGSCPKEVSEGILQEHGLCGVWLSLRGLGLDLVCSDSGCCVVLSYSVLL